MSLFERIQYRLNEESTDSQNQNKKSSRNKKKFGSRQTFSRTVDPNQQQELPFDYSKTGKEDPVKDVKSTRDIIGNRKPKGRRFGSKNRPKETNPNQQLEIPFDDGKKKRAPRKGVDYFFDPDKAKKERDAFQQGRKAYTDSKSGIKAGKVTDKGVIDYITKARNMKQGTNANTKANREAAKIIAKSSGSEYKEKIRTKYETDKDLPRKRPSNAKSLEQIKKEIDSRPPDGRTTRTKVKTPSVKRIETKVTDKEIQDLIKQGRQTKPTKTKKITVGAISKRDKAIKDIDDLIIEPKKGEAAATEKGFKKQKRFYQQQQQQQPQSGPRTRTRTRTRTNTRTPPGDKSYKDLKKEIENIKKNLKNPVDKSFGDVLKKNQTGFVQPKIKPITKTITPLKAITKTKPASRFGRVMKALRKNPKTAAAALAIGTGVYLYNKGKNKPKSIPPVIGGGNKIKSATTTDINFTLGGKGAGRTSKGAN